MKKIILAIVFLFTVGPMMTSCNEDDLHIIPDYSSGLETLDTEEKLQAFLNQAYLRTLNVAGYGAEAIMIPEIMSDGIFSTSYLTSRDYLYNELNSEFSAYGLMYSIILNCNFVINNEIVLENPNVNRIKAEARLLRAFAYMNLINTYAATPTSGMHQDFGVPLVLGDFDMSIQPERATVPEVYSQIIEDLQKGIQNAPDAPGLKNYLTKTAGKLLLSRVYLTRRADGDAQKALDLTTDIMNNSPSVFAPISATEGNVYKDYFTSTNAELCENQPETIWELDNNQRNASSSGIGSNISLPSYFERASPRTSILFTQDFFNSFGENDVRRNMFTTQSVPQTDDPTGLYTTKWAKKMAGANYQGDVKILRYSEVQLNRIEALYLTGQSSQALQELNAFALSRNGSTYSGANLLDEILTEKHKEFFAEGLRFFDLKRHNKPIVRTSNCVVCELSADNLKFVFPMSEGILQLNRNLTQFPGY